MLRCTRATGLYRNVIELEGISVIFGHASIETDRICAISSIKMLSEAMDSC